MGILENIFKKLENILILGEYSFKIGILQILSRLLENSLYIILKCNIIYLISKIKRIARDHLTWKISDDDLPRVLMKALHHGIQMLKHVIHLTKHRGERIFKLPWVNKHISTSKNPTAGWPLAAKTNFCYADKHTAHWTEYYPVRPAPWLEEEKSQGPWGSM